MNKRVINNEVFIQDAIRVHGNKYNYSLINYKNNYSKVKIICPIHGQFEQSYQKHCHLKRGCWECGKKSCVDKIKLSQEQFIEKARKIHGDKYDYSLVEYISSQEKIKIICPIHGVFEQVSTSHLQGVNCKNCSHIKLGKSSRKGKEKVLKTFYEKHGNSYSYDIPDDIKTSDKITIKCPNHGEFSQIVSVHYNSGCPKCGDERTGEYQRKKPKELDRVCRNLRRRLKNFMQKKGYKKSEKTCDIIGCTWEDLKKHLEDNPYSFKVTCLDLDTDHIIPISSAQTEADLYKLTHYTNLQLLPKDYNQHIKRDKPFNREHFEKWLIETKYNKC